MSPNSLTDKLLRGGLAAAFLFFGLTKLSGTAGTIPLYDAIGFGQFPRFVTGSIETLGAVGMWLSGLQGFAALLLALTMCVAIFAMTVLVGGAFWHLALLLILSAWVAVTWRAQILGTLNRA